MSAPFQQALLAWFETGRRPLAWRTTRDPYAVLVSEVMLQQTQASRVEPAWRAFCEQFPTVHALASASTAEVVTAWRGLGYNRRAISLARAARMIVSDHEGKVPADLEALRALPGVGEYTARAVLAFAFNRDAAPVDTNISRVLARAVAGRRLAGAETQALADSLVPAGGAARWNAALMDFGASVCTARSPACSGCPVARVCAWQVDGADQDPAAVSAGRPRPQSPFAGSDRYHRGRLVDALRSRPVAAANVPGAAGLDDVTRAAAVAAGLVADGLAEWAGDELRLPEA